MSGKRKKKSEPGECPKCKAKNPEDAKFCNKCGARLQIPLKGGFEGLVTLHTVAGLYVLLSATFNILVKELFFPFFLIIYLVSGVMGLGVAYALNAGKIKRWIKFLSLAMVITGFVGTFLLFLLPMLVAGSGVELGWVIFLITAWKLWQDRYSF